MNKILTINNVRAYIDENGVAQLNLEDCARGLGFTEKAASGNETIRWRTVKSYLASFSTIATTCDDVPAFIPENIFYRLAMKAKNETAEGFQSIVCDEILPQIRKTGSYTKIPQTYAEALRLAADQAEQIEQQKAQLTAAKPKVQFYDQVRESEHTLSMNDAAKLLGIKGLGRNKLFEQLRSRGILDESNVPYQRFLNSGHFEVIEKPYDYNGMVGITKVTRVTQKGLQWMSKEFSRVNH